MEEDTKVNKNKWQGVKNFFGKTNPILKKRVLEASTALQNLSNEANADCKELELGEKKIKEPTKKVWDQLFRSLIALKELSKTTDEQNCNGKGREFANYVFKEYNIKKASELSTLNDFDNFGKDVEILQLIANRTPSTSSIPSWIHSAAKNTTRFFAYARTYYAIFNKSDQGLNLTFNELNDLKDDLDAFAKKMQSDIESIRKWENIKTKIYDNTLGKIKSWWTKIRG